MAKSTQRRLEIRWKEGEDWALVLALIRGTKGWA